jgi:hypothetical protein
MRDDDHHDCDHALYRRRGAAGGASAGCGADADTRRSSCR